MCCADVPCRFSSTDVTESSRPLDKTQSPCHQVSWQPHREMPTHPLQTLADSKGRMEFSSFLQAQQPFPHSQQQDFGVTHETSSILTSCGVGLDGLKGGRGAGQDRAAVQRGRGLQQLRVQCRWLALEVTTALGLCRWDIALWNTPRNVISHQPRGSCGTDSALAGSAGQAQAAAQGEAFLLSSTSIFGHIFC